MPVSEDTYMRVAREADDTLWELHCGRLVEKPPMTAEHTDTIEHLFRQLAPQLPEVWSPLTGVYDLTTTVKEYQRRGDAEIWCIHPSERTLTAWRRRPDGSYTEAVFRGGIIRPVALPNVTVDLDVLFG